MKQKRDEYGVILDFLPRGKPSDRRMEPIAQVIGDRYFTLLEVVIKEGVEVKPGEKIYIGEGKWDKVKYIKGRIRYEELTNFSRNGIESILQKIVEDEEKRFVDFFNKAMPLSARAHMLELLPGIGKKHLWSIIKERKKKPFESFEDLRKRVEMLPDPKKMIVKRILEELEGKDRYRLFVGGLF